jgi:hypothetical protein
MSVPKHKGAVMRLAKVEIPDTKKDACVIDAYTLVRILGYASEKYREDAKTMNTSDNFKWVEEHFIAMAKQAQAIGEFFADITNISVETESFENSITITKETY